MRKDLTMTSVRELYDRMLINKETVEKRFHDWIEEIKSGGRQESARLLIDDMALNLLDRGIITPEEVQRIFEIDDDEKQPNG